MVTCQQDQACEPAIIELGKITARELLQTIDIGDEVVSVAVRACAQTNQVDAEHADVA